MNWISVLGCERPEVAADIFRSLLKRDTMAMLNAPRVTMQISHGTMNYRSEHREELADE